MMGLDERQSVNLDVIRGSNLERAKKLSEISKALGVSFHEQRIARLELLEISEVNKTHARPLWLTVCRSAAALFWRSAAAACWVVNLSMAVRVPRPDRPGLSKIRRALADQV